ncbi:hypothetical protein KHU1_0071 [Bacillus amyloliquefaciens KHG19]|nr:hypothetical protein KHU1_0071 [Bacillus amyloliquefaciens KHG19]ANB47234.1 hypothetical protein A1D33_007870 [Bacillus velezensis]
MHPPHILIGENQRVTGLLDWTEAKVADPAKDFVLYQVILGEMKQNGEVRASDGARGAYANGAGHARPDRSERLLTSAG